jgi:hypothetical protein
MIERVERAVKAFLNYTGSVGCVGWLKLLPSVDLTEPEVLRE